MQLNIKNGRGFFEGKTANSQQRIYINSIYNEKKFKMILRFEQGSQILHRTIENGVCVMPDLEEGFVKVELLIYMDNLLLKKIPCDKLLIVNLTDGLQSIPEIEILKEEIQQLKKEIQTFVTILKVICNKNKPVKFNLRLGQELNIGQCDACPFFNEKENKCQGFGICCFDVDPKTLTIIDPVTKLPLPPEMVLKYKEKLKNMEGE